LSNLFLESNSVCFGHFLCPSSVLCCMHSNGICHAARKLSADLYEIYHCCVYSEVLSWSRSQAVSKPVWHIPLLYNEKTPDDRQRKCLKHAEFCYKNKFEKLVHLVGFIIRILLVLEDQCQVVPLRSPLCSSLCTIFLPFICVWHLLKYEVTQHIWWLSFTILNFSGMC
jgi:hypothetical protein